MTRKWHLYDAVTHEKNNVMKMFINQEECLILIVILIFLLLAHAQTFDRCVDCTGFMGGWQLPLILPLFHDRPSKEICQSFENLTEHARNGKTETCFRRHFFVRDLPSI